MDLLKEKYETDKKTWDECAETYERQIVGGHPDILAFEEFEEDLLDRLLRHLSLKQDKPIKLMDIGCGSGRLHIRYGAKTKSIAELPITHPLVNFKDGNSKLAFDPDLAKALNEVWGIDFSQNMIDLAENKLVETGLRFHPGIELTFEQGSAFQLSEQPGSVLPLAICLVNSIGVMQGSEGANALFSSMRRAVEKAGGIAIISCYQGEYIDSYALGQYESTMDVSGQPAWMSPDTYASPEFKKVPRQYKLAHSNDSGLVVDVFDMNDNLIEKGYKLTRDKDKTAKTIQTGDINTHSNYKSHWYSYNEIEQLIKEHWSGSHSYHIKTQDLDMLRAEPAQLAILDCSGHFGSIFKRWKVL